MCAVVALTFRTGVDVPADLDADDRKPEFSDPAEKPRRQRASPKTDTNNLAADPSDASRDVFKIAGDLKVSSCITDLMENP
ncbi:hypothetical protein WOC76_21610 [Methylocystis sp. IM3]|uniref:hypothetical protein n=1 Tax=unclassified Methylocystis TaxID=2625913 RepID=UPI0030F54A2C